MRFVRTLALSLAIPLAIAVPSAAHADPATTAGQGLPYMGWNTYYGLGGDPTAAEIKSIADTMVADGLRDAGYKIIWIDGNWAATTSRNAAGQLVADPVRFPDGMAALTDYVHSLGFQAGIYTDAGPYLAGHCALGSYGHYHDDVQLFASWGFDALKADWLCGNVSGLDPETAYRQLAAEVAQSPRPMLLNICNPVSTDWGGGPYPPPRLSSWSYTYGPQVAASWRTNTDVGFGDPQPPQQYQWVLRNMDINAAHPAATSPGHFNDPDYLVPMRPLPGGGTQMTLDESKTQLGMWAMMASPLIIGSDPRTLPAGMVSALSDPEVLAVDQDPLVRQGVKVADPSGTTQVWSKALTGSGRRAVALLNRGSSAAQITVTFASVTLGGFVRVRDLWARSDAGSFSGSYTTTVPAHGVAMLGLTGTEQFVGNDLGQSGTDGPAVAGGKVFARSASGMLQAYAGGTWTDLGKQIVGQPAAYPSAGGRVDLFVRGTDDQVWHGVLSGGQTTWTSLGGALTEAPTAAFTSPAVWTVFARGTDRQLWFRGPSSSWSPLGAPVAPAADGFNGRPSASIDGSGAVHVAVRARTDEIWERVQTGGVWSGWRSLGGTLNDSPTLVAAGGWIYMFAVAADDRLWQRNFINGAWGSWALRPDFATFEIQGAIGGEATADGHASVALRGIDGHVRSTTL